MIAGGKITSETSSKPSLLTCFKPILKLTTWILKTRQGLGEAGWDWVLQDKLNWLSYARVCTCIHVSVYASFIIHIYLIIATYAASSIWSFLSSTWFSTCLMWSVPEISPQFSLAIWCFNPISKSKVGPRKSQVGLDQLTIVIITYPSLA